MRVRGVAQRATEAESAKDFLARHPKARAIALAGQQSPIFSTDATRDELISQAAAAAEVDAGIVSPHLTAWTVVPNSVEFWQDDPSRHHQRLSYMRTETAWDKQRLWPCGAAAIYHPSCIGFPLRNHQLYSTRTRQAAHVMGAGDMNPGLVTRRRHEPSRTDLQDRNPPQPAVWAGTGPCGCPGYAPRMWRRAVSSSACLKL